MRFVKVKHQFNGFGEIKVFNDYFIWEWAYYISVLF